MASRDATTSASPGAGGAGSASGVGGAGGGSGAVGTGSAGAWREAALVFEGRQGQAVAILTEPVGTPRVAVLIVAGQPQTRVGSHRMFTDLARGLAARGIASLRFDIGGWGDSPGDPLPFERSDLDIAAAARALRAALPPATRLWLWGLCDGASAAVLALPVLRAAGVEPQTVCLVNPWVRSDASHSEALVRTYYAKRLFAAEFWGRLLTGRMPMRNLVLEPLRHLTARFRRAGDTLGSATTSASASGSTAGSAAGTDPAAEARADLPSQLLRQLDGFRGTVLTVLSGDDLTAGETEALIRRDKRWRKRLEQRGEVLRVAGADHTFSDPEQWRRVCDWIAAKARH